MALPDVGWYWHGRMTWKLVGTALLRLILVLSSHSGEACGCGLLQAVLGVPENFTFEACSDRVAAVLGPDVMRSTKVGHAPCLGISRVPALLSPCCRISPGIPVIWLSGF